MLERRWLAGHVTVIVVVGVFVALGFWQLARDRHKHHLVAAAKAAYAAPASDLLSASTPAAGARTQATGTFDPAHEVLLRNQVSNGNYGDDVLTPLRLTDGSAVLVDRGWIPDPAGGPFDAPVSTGTVTARGLAHTSSPLAPQDSVATADGRLALPRVDLTRIGHGLPYPLRPVWIEAQSLQPAPPAGAPTLPQPPAPDPVNHMEYAIEWFAFALIPIIGWPIVLYRVARKRQRVSP